MQITFLEHNTWRGINFLNCQFNLNIQIKSMWENVKKQTAARGTITNLESLFINKKVLLGTAIPTKYK